MCGVCSAGVRAQYQFRSFDITLATCNNEPPPPAAAAADAECAFVSVDCRRLTQSVRSVPLYHRLCVDLSLLPLESHVSTLQISVV